MLGEPPGSPKTPSTGPLRGQGAPRLPGHRALDGLLLLGRKRDGRASAVEVLDVDARVVAALDRGHYGARARRVEKSERRRLLSTRPLVRVVADDRGVRHRPVDTPVDPREPGRNLVDGAVEIVDTALERDGEVEQVAAVAPQHDALRGLHPREPAPEREGEGEGEGRRRAGRYRHRERGGHNVKMTGYSAVLLAVFVSPGTGSTSTLTEICSPKGTSAPTLRTTALVSPGSMIEMIAVFTIASGCFGMVRVTLMRTSWLSPVSSTPTSNESSSDTLIVVSVVVDK